MESLNRETETIDDIARLSLLYDFYGQLLTERQRQVYELYYGENLSLGEIAEEIGISRQGVHDALRSARRTLEGYEDKLALVDRFLRTDAAIEEIDRQILFITDLLRAGSDESGPKGVMAAQEENETKDETGNESENRSLFHEGRRTAEVIRRLERVRTIIDGLEE